MKGDDDKEEQTTSTPLVCDLDKTTMLGGFSTLTEDIGNSGLPYLRNVPVLKWFVSQDNNNKQDLKLVILACPHICNEDEDIPVVIQVVDPQQVHEAATKPLNEVNKKPKSIWKPNTWLKK